MTNEPPLPTTDALRQALSRVRPELAAGPITFVGDGWDFWTYDAAGYIVRVAKQQEITDGDESWPVVERLHIDRRLLQALEPTSTLPLPVPEIYAGALADGRPLALHKRLSGVPLVDLKRSLAPGFGAALGRFLRAMHDFPVERAIELGVSFEDGPAKRKMLIDTYETYVRRAFPLLGCESRTHAERTFEAYINEASFFDFKPRLSHADANHHNLLADPDTGELTGVIDFTDTRVCDRSIDALWACFGGFERHGIADELPDFLATLGLQLADVEKHRAFIDVWWPLDDLDHGVEIGDRDLIEDAIYRLYAVTPRGIICDV